MKKVLLCVILSVLLGPRVFSQKELWGYKGYENGAIIKTALEGTNQQPQIVHAFPPDGMTGKFPKGRLFQASNGKLYGITSFRSTESEPDAPRGILFSYDPLTSEFSVLSTTLIQELDGNLGGLIEPFPGVLYGTTNGGNSIFKYDIATGVGSVVGSIPYFIYNWGTWRPMIRGELMKASDGFIYCVTDMAPSNQNVPYHGGIYRFNLSTNQFTKVYFANAEVIHFEFDTQLIETSPGILYGTSKGGSHYGPDGVAPVGSGTLFQFTIATNTVEKKYDFDYVTEGMQTTPVIQSGNKLYGALYGQNNTSSISPYANPFGVFYEYDLTTQALTFLHPVDPLQDDLVENPVGRLMMASNGKLYGACVAGNYEYDVSADAVHKKIQLDAQEPMALIEICRKPSYRPAGTAYTVCSGTPFTFDLHNDNASSFVWKKGATILPGQTTGILEFDAITVADSGIYTCEMTNECGITITPAVTITVNASNASTVTSAIPMENNHTMICPGTSVILTGNNSGGSWNTGATTPTLEVTEAGQYQIINANACGNTYSNIVTVGLYETLAPIAISYLNNGMCLGNPITFYGNTDGTWPDGSTGETYTTTLEVGTPYFVTRTNECGTITSNVFNFEPWQMGDVNITPQIIPDGLTSICSGGSLTLNSNKAFLDTAQWTWYTMDPFSYFADGGSITITEPGTYILRRSSYCFGTVESQPVVVTLSAEAPPAPVISLDGNPAEPYILRCAGDSVTLQSNAQNPVWNSGQTTASITVTTSGWYNVTSANGCGSANSESVYINFFANPTAEVSQNENVLTSAEAFMSYQWMLCGANGVMTNIPGASQQSFTATQAGSYAVKVNNPQSCSTVSACFTVTEQDLSVSPHDMSNDILLYPNPAHDKLFLKTDLGIERISITNMLGQVVLRTHSTTEINVEALPIGCYVLTAESGNGKWMEKFVKE